MRLVESVFGKFAHFVVQRLGRFLRHAVCKRPGAFDAAVLTLFAV